ncbi:hypothetical protein DIPPA_33523 [Diplonema papillatum]|nr:hypothetical protein DIPPA_33523 [Diplonema papillatum]
MGEESPVAQVSEGAESVYPAVVAAGVVSTSANPGGLASRLLLVTAGCHVKGEDQDLPRAFHPTGVSVDGSQALGMVHGNFALMAGFSTLCYLVLKFAQVAGERAFPKLFEGLDTQGVMRLPSAPLMVFTFLYQGTTFGAVMLLMEPPHLIGFFAGLLSFVLCAAVPMCVFYRMHRSVPAQAVYLLDDVYKGKIWAFVIGPGEWVSVQRKNHWVNRYASVMRTYRQETVWFSLVEFCSMFALAAVSATRVESVTACGHVKLFSAMIFFVQLGAEVVLLPHEVGRNNALDFVFLSCQTCGLLCTSAGYYAQDVHHWTHRAAAKFFLAAWGTLAVKVLCDLLTELFVLIKGRRGRLQEKAFGLWKEPAADEKELLEEGGGAIGYFAADNVPSEDETNGSQGKGTANAKHNGKQRGSGPKKQSLLSSAFVGSPRNGGPRASPLTARGVNSSFDTCDYRELTELHGSGSSFFGDTADRTLDRAVMSMNLFVPTQVLGSKSMPVSPTAHTLSHHDNSRMNSLGAGMPSSPAAHLSLSHLECFRKSTVSPTMPSSPTAHPLSASHLECSRKSTVSLAMSPLTFATRASMRRPTLKPLSIDSANGGQAAAPVLSPPAVCVPLSATFSPRCLSPFYLTSPTNALATTQQRRKSVVPENTVVAT